MQEEIQNNCQCKLCKENCPVQPSTGKVEVLPVNLDAEIEKPYK